MQQKGVNGWAAWTARTEGQKQRKCMHGQSLPSAGMLLHFGAQENIEIEMNGKGRQWEFQVECTPFSLHIPLQTSLPRKFCSRVHQKNYAGRWSGAGHWDNSLFSWCAHALIQPRWGKLCKREVLKLAEPSSWVKNGMYHMMKRMSSLHFLWLIWLVKELEKKNARPFFPIEFHN